MKIEMTVNGTRHEIETPGLRRLLDVLRLDLGLAGTKEGCGEGECGACSVILNGELVCSCLVPAAQADGAAVTTIEGLAFDAAESAPILEHMMDSGGAQCGICTPGMIMAGYDFLQRCARLGRPVDRESIRWAIAGNLCRCTGYVKIVDAIAAAWANRAQQEARG